MEFVGSDLTRASDNASAFAGGGSLANASAALAADVQLPASNTWVDGPSLALGPGTWLIQAQFTFQRTATTAAQYGARITNGTAHYSSGQCYQASANGHTAQIGLTAIVALEAAATIKLQGLTSAGSASSLMKAAIPVSGSGNNATRIDAVQIV